MRNVFKIAAILLGFVSCQKQEEVTVTASVKVFCELGRGVLSYRDEVENLNVFAYKDGLLYEQAYSNSNSLDIELNSGCSYSVYALANVGEMNAPASESNLGLLRCDLHLADVGSPTPMVSVGPATIVAKDGEFVSVEMERLISICRLKIDKQFTNGDFILKGAKLKQVPYDICPFADASAATKTGDGDYVSSADIVKLNNGGCAEFYMLENCQGVLLPGNKYQWQKVPASIKDKQDVCTYLEVDGWYKNNVNTATVAYRMYLGKDNCTDFNVTRNTINLVTLTLTDKGVYRDSWQVEYYGL